MRNYFVGGLCILAAVLCLSVKVLLSLICAIVAVLILGTELLRLL